MSIQYTNELMEKIIYNKLKEKQNFLKFFKTIEKKTFDIY